MFEPVHVTVDVRVGVVSEDVHEEARVVLVESLARVVGLACLKPRFPRHDRLR